jgi:hypothetical protein
MGSHVHFVALLVLLAQVADLGSRGFVSADTLPSEGEYNMQSLCIKFEIPSLHDLLGRVLQVVPFRFLDAIAL